MVNNYLIQILFSHKQAPEKSIRHYQRLIISSVKITFFNKLTVQDLNYLKSLIILLDVLLYDQNNCTSEKTRLHLSKQENFKYYS